MQESKIIYDHLMSRLGLPYIWGGQSPLIGFDCSGLVIDTLSAVGIVPHRFDTTSRGLYKRFSERPHGNVVDRCGFGTLIFYGASKNKISHVGFGISGDLIIEAAGGGSTTKTPEDALRVNACVRIRPYDYRGDLVGYARPSYFSSLE